MSSPDTASFFRQREQGQEKVLIPELFDGARVAEISHEIFKQVDVRLGANFVKAGVILTMAGLKPMTSYISVEHVTEDDEVTALRRESELVNRHLDQVNSQLSIGEEIRKIPARGRLAARSILPLDFMSTRGAERISKSSRFKGVPQFDKDKEDAIMAWYWEIGDWIENAKKEGNIPSNFDAQVFQEGITLGYPEQAIWDFADWVATGRKKDLEHGSFTLEGKHWSAVPSYDYYPEHEDDPGIIENIRVGNEVLRQFYESEAYEAIVTSSKWQGSQSLFQIPWA